jgi:hypothetical protein
VSWRRDAAAMGRDVGQLLWAVLLFDLFIALLGYLSRRYFGELALPVALGLAGYVTAVFLLVLAANFLVAGAVDALRRLRRWRRVPR